MQGQHRPAALHSSRAWMRAELRCVLLRRCGGPSQAEQCALQQAARLEAFRPRSGFSQASVRLQSGLVEAWLRLDVGSIEARLGLASAQHAEHAEQGSLARARYEWPYGRSYG